MFGFGEDDNVQQPQQEKSFFGSIFSFIGSALKWAAIAVAAVVTLGFIFKNDAIRNTVDKLPGLDGKGLASTIIGFKDKIVDKVTGFFGFSSSSTEPPAQVEEVKYSKVMAIDSSFVNSGKDRKEFEQLANMKLAEATANSRLQLPEDRDAAVAKLAELTHKNMNTGSRLNQFDVMAKEIIDRNKDPLAPKPPIFDLESKLPAMPEKFNKLGEEKFGEDKWNALSKLDQHKAIDKITRDDIANKPDYMKLSLQGTFLDSYVVDKSRESGTSVSSSISSQVVGILADTKASDKAIEATRKQEIKGLVDDGKYDEAGKLAGEAKKFFAGRTEDKTKYSAEYAKENRTEMDVKLIREYKEVTRDFEELAKHIEKLKTRDEYLGVASRVHSAINSVAETIPGQINKYERDKAAYANDQTPAPAPDKTAAATGNMDKAIMTAKAPAANPTQEQLVAQVDHSDSLSSGLPVVGKKTTDQRVIGA